jgi:uncharacterized protein (TIGR02271 family)
VHRIAMRETKGLRAMLDNQDQPQTSSEKGEAPIVSGTPVFDVAGEKLGDVSEPDAGTGYLIVHKGFLFPKDIYVPESAIARKTTDGVFLNLDKRQIQDQGWSQPPTSASAGWTDTTQSDTGPMGSPTDRDVTDYGTLERGRRSAGEPSTPVQQGDVAVPVHQEEMVARTQPKETGGAHVRKDVAHEQQTLNVPVRREEVTVEHVLARGRGDVAHDAFTERDIDIPVMGEQVYTEKRTNVKDELHLHKRPVTDTEQVSDSVRKDRVNVEGAEEQGRVPPDRGGDNPPVSQ